MPSFKYRNTPDGIATLVEALRRSPLVKSVNAGELLQYAETNKTATAWINVEFTETVKSTFSIGLYQPRRKRASKGSKRTRQLEGYVYLLRSAEGHCKIGKTVNPKSRKRTFDVKLPFRVEYEHVIQTDDMHKLEKLLHERFREGRIGRSEFFALCSDDILFIKSLGASCTIAQYNTICEGSK